MELQGRPSFNGRASSDETFWELHNALADEDALIASQAADWKHLQAEADHARAELSRLQSALPTADRQLSELEQAAADSRRRRADLVARLDALRPRLSYCFDLPPDASLSIVGRLGRLRRRAAQACTQFRLAVRAAERALPELQHRVVAMAAAGGSGDQESEGHTVVCTGEAVFTFGQAEYGALGHPGLNCDRVRPTRVSALRDEQVVAATATQEATIVCTKSGQLLWFGLLDPIPRPIGGLPQVAGLAAGGSHLLAWTTEGQLYSWAPEASLDSSKPAAQLVAGLQGERVLAADGGNDHSVVRTASCQLFTFGEGPYALGHGPNVTVLRTPQRVQALADRRVVRVAAGGELTAVVLESGELYTCGEGVALGHGEQEGTGLAEPRQVLGLKGKRLVGISAGAGHMLAWTDQGELYSWGDGEYGELGHGDTAQQWAPRLVQALEGRAVKGAAAGYGHSVVFTSSQHVWSWGSQQTGQLGLGRKSQQPVLLPQLVEGLDPSSPPPDPPAPEDDLAQR